MILVHSFPTNSIILKGLIEYLEEYCNVYFIDLPGFTKKVPPLKEITLEAYSNYLDHRIKSLKIKSYIAAGISFGFLVVNNAKLDKRCKGIIALEPYINFKSLNMNFLKKSVYMLLADSFLALNLGFLLKNKIPLQIDQKTFLKTASLILKNNKSVNFKNLPYILIINKNDGTVKSNYLLQKFKKTKHLTVYTAIDHYPKDLSKAYFEKMMPKSMLEKISSYIKKYN